MLSIVTRNSPAYRPLKKNRSPSQRPTEAKITRNTVRISRPSCWAVIAHWSIHPSEPTSATTAVAIPLSAIGARIAQIGKWLVSSRVRSRPENYGEKPIAGGALRFNFAKSYTNSAAPNRCSNPLRLKHVTRSCGAIHTACQSAFKFDPRGVNIAGRMTVGTNRMFALVTASQMASASAASFFCRASHGQGGINRTV